MLHSTRLELWMSEHALYRSSIEREIRMNVGLQHLTATPKDGPRPTSIKSSMRPPRTIGLLIR